MSLINIATDSYNNFRSDALARASQGLGYDVDNAYGYQQLCWDLCAELWQNIGFPSGYPQTGPQHYVKECWTVSRLANAGNDFSLITNITDLKRGDVIVLDGSPISATGHIAFCDENYNGTTNMPLLGQNQVDPNFTTGHIPTITNLSISAFLGAFRYNAWHQTPPTPPIHGGKRGHFPWVLYTRKLNEKRGGM